MNRHRKYNMQAFSAAKIGVNQTIFDDLIEIDEIETVKDGYGEDSFVVIKAIKH